MIHRRDGMETRARILEVASNVFAEKGFEKTTHEEICRLANANIGAVNYHFQSKGNLFKAAWRYAYEKSLEKHPIDGGVSKDAPAEEQLYGHITSLMYRVADPENIDMEIAFRDMTNAPGLLGNEIGEAMAKSRTELCSIIGALLGKGFTDEEIQLCEMSIMGQCFNPMVIKERRIPRPPGMPDFSIEKMAKHILKFSLAGIQAIKTDKEIRKA